MSYELTLLAPRTGCHLERHGYWEECFFTFSYSPIRDEREALGGIRVTVTETTSRVLAARRLWHYARFRSALLDSAARTRRAVGSADAIALRLPPIVDAEIVPDQPHPFKMDRVRE